MFLFYKICHFCLRKGKETGKTKSHIDNTMWLFANIFLSQYSHRHGVEVIVFLFQESGANGTKTV